MERTGQRRRKWAQSGALVAALAVTAAAFSVAALSGQAAGRHVRVGHLTSAAAVAQPVVPPATSTVPPTSTTLAPPSTAAAAAPGRPAPAPSAGARVSATSPTTPAPTATSPATSTPTTTTATISGIGLWVLARDGSGLRRLLPTTPQVAAWAPDDARLAVGSSNAIGVVTVATGTSTSLVAFSSPVVVFSLAWSPDGRLLSAIVVHNPTTIGATSSELLLIDAQSGATTSLGRVGSTEPVWSSRGCLGWVYTTVDIFCPGAAVLSLPPLPGSDQFSWSPDGSHYAITSSADATAGAIVTYAANGTDPVDVGGAHVFRLAYLGDGELAFQTLDDPNQLWVQPAAGGTARALGSFATYAVNEVDGGVVAVSNVNAGFRSILALAASGSTPHTLAAINTAATHVTALAWSRDGTAIAAFAQPAG